MLTPVDVVLVEPEIPNNTGNIGRTCVALGARLRLVHPVGFDLSEKACRRAGLDYWPRLSLTEHEDFEHYRSASEGSRRWVLTTRAHRSVFEADFQPGDHLVFGKESSGLTPQQISALGERCVALPMANGERSLNIASAVCSTLYEVIRQFAVAGVVSIEGGRLSTPHSVGLEQS